MAFILSAIALYNSNQSSNPHIIRSGDLPYGIVGKNQQVIVLPIELYNKGKEAVLLEHILPTDTINTILFSSSGKILPAQSIKYDLFISDDKIDSFNDLKGLYKFDLPIYNIRQLIKPDESYKFNIIVAIKSTKPIDTLIGFDIKFSNGQIVEIRDKVPNKSLERNS